MDRISHVINGFALRLDSSGTLVFNDHEFLLDEVIALCMFLHAPGVVELVSSADTARHAPPELITRPRRTGVERATRLDAFYAAMNAWWVTQGGAVARDDEIDQLIAVGTIPAEVVRATWAAVSRVAAPAAAAAAVKPS